MKRVSKILAILVVAALLGGLIAQPVAAQQAVYDEAWLREIATRQDAMNILLNIWMVRTGDHWRSEGQTGTFDVPANTVIIASEMNAGNDPSFEQLAPNIWFTEPGGRFGTQGSFRAFQLDGARGDIGDPGNIDEMVSLVRGLEYAEMIEALDVQWSNNDAVINRWGSSGPLEVLTDQQLTTLQNAGLELQPLIQVLPGNVIVWGELAPGEQHFGLVMIAQNTYLTTCLGGQFVTLRGFRAMQFPEAMPGSVISDTTGCQDKYPVLDPERPVSVRPFGSDTSTATTVPSMMPTATPAP